MKNTMSVILIARMEKTKKNSPAPADDVDFVSARGAAATRPARTHPCP